jgi:WD40 repeat protein
VVRPCLLNVSNVSRKPVTGDAVTTLKGHTSSVAAVCQIQAGDRQLLGSASWDKTVRLWDPVTGDAVTTLEGHDRSVMGVCQIQAGDRQLLASASWDDTVRLWGPVTGDAITTLEGHTNSVMGVGGVVINCGASDGVASCSFV